MIYDEYLAWFASVANLLMSRIMGAESVADVRVRVIFITTASIVGQLIAIRRLVVAGLDTSAKQILRCLAEHIEVAIVLSQSEELANEFVTNEEIEGAAQFWRIYLRAANKRKVISDQFRKLIETQLGVEAAEEIRVFEAEEESVLHAVIHPSYVGCSMAALSGTMDRQKMDWPAWLGVQSSFSIRTF
jgi:hypothetical protein